MRKLASIERITKISAIQDADQIELVTILGWQVIVRKEEGYKVGDLAVYCQYDVLLPADNPNFEFLRKSSYSAKYDAFRIKNRKLRGVYSEGIVFPLSILPEGISRIEGRSVVENLNIRKYDPTEALLEEEIVKSKNPLMRYAWYRKLFLTTSTKKGYPEGLVKSDESNIQAVFDKMQNNAPQVIYYLTEKLEGTNFAASIINGRFSVYSHNVKKHRKDNSTWSRAAILLNIEKKMKKYMKKKRLKSFSVQGELVGPGIQRNIYKLDAVRLYLFNATNLKTKVDLDYKELQHLCSFSEFDMVPIISSQETLLSTSDEILQNAEGMSQLNKNVRREGIVWRARYSPQGKVSFKAKSRDYQNWWLKKDITV